MCGRFSQSGNFEVVHKQCKVTECSVDETPRYNIAPSNEAQVIFHDGVTKAAMLRWGLVPSWSQDEKIARRLVNVRAESLNEKPVFRSLFKKRRCLIPVDGFYEWKKSGNIKHPLRILMKDDLPFALAGLWDRWISPEGKELYTFTIITIEANDLIKTIHARMPVIIEAEDYLNWLAPDIKETTVCEQLLKPFPATKMRLYRVSPIVNNPGFDSPDCIKPVDSDDQLQLTLL